MHLNPLSTLTRRLRHSANFSLCLLMTGLASATSPAPSADWKPVAGTMLTEWGARVTPENAWREAYPRPQMTRPTWTNLNGLWDYQVSPKGTAQPQAWAGKILVPFALETPLSGVGQRLTADQALWYRRSFVYAPRDQRTLLHFEGVDYASQVWLNGRYLGDHRGGNLPFSFDATHAIRNGDNTLLLRVIDETDAFDRYQLRGKQRQDNSGIWYTPSSGIWQTVWLESVPSTYLQDTRFTADMHGAFKLKAIIGGSDQPGLSLRVQLSENGQVVAQTTAPGHELSLTLNEPQLWSPENPHLYQLSVELLDADHKILDTIASYAGFRSTGKVRDADGHWRFTLNGEPIFHLGPLDQGWWPDGFLIPPADEAIVWEMQFLKDAGFNLIRKHKKVEPRRYYYHADRLGLLVWQDQVSGGAGPNEWPKWKKLRADSKGYEPRNENWWTPGHALDADWPDWAHQQYMAELKTMVDTLHNHPSVVVWTAFNERWGQHRSLEVGQWLAAYDPSRHLNLASGGNFFPLGDLADEHNYPHPAYPLENPVFNDYIKVMGEFGGHGWRVLGHQWNTNMDNWGYGGLPGTIEEFKQRYRESMRLLGGLKQEGVAAGVYTQTTDVESEINGLLTYDRKVIKIPVGELRQIHREHGLNQPE